MTEEEDEDMDVGELELDKFEAVFANMERRCIPFKQVQFLHTMILKWWIQDSTLPSRKFQHQLKAFINEVDILECQGFKWSSEDVTLEEEKIEG